MSGLFLRAVLLFAALLSPFTAQAQQKVVFYTNWYAEAEHGGFYQALAEGIYKSNGLDVEVWHRARRLGLIDRDTMW